MGNRQKSPRFALKTAATLSQPDTVGSQVQVGRSRDRRALWGNHGWLIHRWLRADVTTFILLAVTQITAPTHPPPPILSVTSSCRLAALCLHSLSPLTHGIQLMHYILSTRILLPIITFVNSLWEFNVFITGPSCTIWLNSCFLFCFFLSVMA